MVRFLYAIAGGAGFALLAVAVAAVTLEWRARPDPSRLKGKPTPSTDSSSGIVDEVDDLIETLEQAPQPQRTAPGRIKRWKV